MRNKVRFCKHQADGLSSSSEKHLRKKMNINFFQTSSHGYVCALLKRTKEERDGKGMEMWMSLVYFRALRKMFLNLRWCLNCHWVYGRKYKNFICKVFIWNFYFWGLNCEVEFNLNRIRRESRARSKKILLEKGKLIKKRGSNPNI